MRLRPPRILRGRGRCVLTTVLLGLALSACAAGESDAGSSADPTSLTVLVTSEYWWMWNLPSHMPVFLSLFHEHAGEVEGRLVRSWENSPDGLTWTYHMRTDVQWHDGVPVTAQDVKFTLDLLSHPDMLHLPPGAARAEVLDDSTLTIYFEKAGSSRRWAPLEAEIPVYPRHLLVDLDPADFFSWEFWRQPVGDGPFRFVRQIPHTMVVLEANPDYFLGRPAIDRVVLKLAGTARMDLLAAVVDVADAFTVEPLEAFQLDGEPDFDAFWTIGDWVYAILWNHRNPIFGDPRVRRAFSLAIDRREIARVLSYPEKAPLWDVPATPGQRGSMDVIPPVAHDLGLAESLLEEAGWRDEDGDGIRERGPVQLRFTLLTRDPGLAVLLQDRFRRIGADVDVVTSPGRDRELLEAGEFDASLVTSFNTSGPNLKKSMVEAGHVIPHPELERILVALDTIVDPTIRDRMFREMWPVIQEEQPITILLPSLFVSVANSRVRGLSSPDRAIATAHMEELWIEEDE